MVHNLTSTYVEHLPAVLQEGELVGAFLLAFEAVLTGLPGPTGHEPADAFPAPTGYLPSSLPVGLEQLLDRGYAYYDPLGDTARDGPNAFKTPEEFLPWLAQWVATSLRDDWDVTTKRKFISQIVPLYRKRGTRAGLEAVLQLAAGDVQVVEFDEAEGKPRHYFKVIVTQLERDPALLGRKIRMVRAMVEREKPAHTYYGLVIRYPAMRIWNNPTAPPDANGPGVVVGVTTVLGTIDV
jgi:phage tail-like protein